MLDVVKRDEKRSKRDFASLTSQEALHVAIFIEERNAEIYYQFAEMFAGFREAESLEIAATFWDMAAEERQHGTLLQKRYFDRYGTRPCAVTEDDVNDFIELPRLENGELFTFSRLKVGRSPREMALEIAIAAEQNAARYYTRLSETTKDPELRELYRELMTFEASHSDGLEKKLAEARRTSGGTKLA
jgi:rubrerythrin